MLSALSAPALLRATDALSCNCTPGGPTPVFFDTFDTLKLFNTRNTAAGGTWQPAGTFGSFVDGQDANQVWLVNPFNPATSSATFVNTYTVCNSNLQMSINNSPDTTKTGGDALIGGQLHTFNTFMHSVQGYWECIVAAPALPGSLCTFWLNDQTGNQQINIAEIVTEANGSHFNGQVVWDPKPVPPTVSGVFYSYQMTTPIDTTLFNSYGAEVTSSQVTFFINRAVTATFPLPSGYVNPMFIFLEWDSGGPPQGTGFISAPLSAESCSQWQQVGYWSARPF